METIEYIRLFFPFELPEFAKGKAGNVWNINDRIMIALAMTYRNDPQAMTMTFMRDYGKRYDWLIAAIQLLGQHTRMLFIAPTHAIWSRPLSSSVMPERPSCSG